MIALEEICAIYNSCETTEDATVANKRFLGWWCEAEGCEKEGTVTRQGCQYVKALSNYSRLCPVHQDDMNNYWNEMFAEYYADVL